MDLIHLYHQTIPQLFHNVVEMCSLVVVLFIYFLVIEWWLEEQNNETNYTSTIIGFWSHLTQLNDPLYLYFYIDTKRNVFESLFYFEKVFNKVGRSDVTLLILRVSPHFFTIKISFLVTPKEWCHTYFLINKNFNFNSKQNISLIKNIKPLHCIAWKKT